jgi:sec-independent protein translocase protein TatA
MGFLGEPTHWILILLLLLVLFGYKRLPEMGKGLGEGLKGFKDGLKGASDTPAAPTAQQTAASAPPASPAPTAEKAGMEYVTCSRCGNKFENPLGFKVMEYVCRSCQSNS